MKEILENQGEVKHEIKYNVGDPLGCLYNSLVSCSSLLTDSDFVSEFRHVAMCPG